MTGGDVAVEVSPVPVVSATGFEPGTLFPVDGVHVPVLPAVLEILQR